MVDGLVNLSLVRQDKCKIVVSFGVKRINLNRPPESLRRLFVFSLLAEEKAKIEVRLVHIGIQLNSRIVMLFSLGKFSHSQIGRQKVTMCLGQRGVFFKS